MIFTIKEKIDVRRFVVVEGTTTTYVHGNGATGVIVKFDADDTAKNNEGFAEFAKNIALQLGAFSTTPYLDRDSVPASVIAQEKEIISEQIKNDPKNASKPEAIIEKMAVGRLGKYYEENCLVDQAYIKDDSLTVGKYVEQTAKAFGGSIKITGFVIYNKGEGIEKRVDNLDDEVAKLLNK